MNNIDQYRNRIICGDCLEIMKELPDGCIDLTVTSPPYDNLREYKGYVFDFEGIAKQLFRITKQGGVVVWVVGDATVKGSETGTSFRQALHFKNIGFRLHDTMIYEKINYIPLTHNRYEQAFEYMFVLTKKTLDSFNPILLSCVTSGKYTHRRNTGRVKEAATRNRDEITTTKDSKYKSNIWQYVIGKLKGETGVHPAPFPNELARDHIISWSNPGDIVLDPMCGSGTTCAMAKKLGRDYIGIDVAQEYVDITTKRVNFIDYYGCADEVDGATPPINFLEMKHGTD